MNPKIGITNVRPNPKDWVLGSVTACPWEEVNPSGDWLPYKSDPHEMQWQEGVDLAMCTNFAATDTVEAILFHLYGERHDYNERALAVMSNQQKDGNNLSIVAETIRKKGLVPQELHKWTPSKHKTYDEMISASLEEMSDWEEAGKVWLDTYDFKWEWVYDDYGKGMVEALKCSPLFAASLYASEVSKDSDGVYQTELPNSTRTTHAIVLMKQEDGHKWIDDSYATQIKCLAPDFRVPVGIRFYVREKVTNEPMYYPPKNSLVIVPETGERMMYVDGDTIYKDDAGKILLEINARSAQDGVSMPFPIVHVKPSDIEHLKRINLSGNPV